MTPRRVLFVVPPLAGHINPTLGVGGELARRGHEVAWTGYAEVLTDLLPEGRTWIPVADHLPGRLVQNIEERASGLRGAAALKFLWEDFLHPLAEDMVDGVAAAVARFKPDVVVVDQQTFGGAVVAEREDLLWATSATTSAELVDSFAGLPKIREWADDLLVEFEVDHGIPRSEATADRLRYSRHLVLAFTTRALVAGELRSDAPMAFVGPAITERPDDTAFPWDRLENERRPIVLVSLGTVNAEAGQRFFQTAARALTGRGLLTVMVAPPDLVGPVPDDVLVMRRVPQLALLPRVAAVVCHGGHNTVCESLSHGIPLVVVPIRDDQPVIAEQVVNASAGVRIRFSRPTVDTIWAAVERALNDPVLRRGAGVVAASFAEAGGASGAADRLEQLAVGQAGASTVVAPSP